MHNHAQTVTACEKHVLALAKSVIRHDTKNCHAIASSAALKTREDLDVHAMCEHAIAIL